MNDFGVDWESVEASVDASKVLYDLCMVVMGKKKGYKNVFRIRHTERCMTLVNDFVREERIFEEEVILLLESEKQ